MVVKHVKGHPINTVTRARAYTPQTDVPSHPSLSTTDAQTQQICLRSEIRLDQQKLRQSQRHPTTHELAAVYPQRHCLDILSAASPAAASPCARAETSGGCSAS